MILSLCHTCAAPRWVTLSIHLFMHLQGGPKNRATRWTHEFVSLWSSSKIKHQHTKLLRPWGFWNGIHPINFVPNVISNSPDLIDKTLVRSTAASLADLNDVDELKQCEIGARDSLKQSVIDNWIDEWCKRHCTCLRQMRAFSAFIEISEHLYTHVLLLV